LGLSLPSSRPEELSDRFPRSFRVHNDSRWTEAFASSPPPVVEDARTVCSACAWTQVLHNRLLDVETDRLDGQLSAWQLLNELIFTRTAVHQLFLIFVIRYTVLQSQASNPALAANLQDLLLAPEDREAEYCPTKDFFAAAGYSKRAFAVSRELADHVQARIRPRRGPLGSP